VELLDPKIHILSGHSTINSKLVFLCVQNSVRSFVFCMNDPIIMNGLILCSNHWL